MKLYCVDLTHSNGTGGRALFEDVEDARQYYAEMVKMFEGTDTKVEKQIIERGE